MSAGQTGPGPGHLSRAAKVAPSSCSSRTQRNTQCTVVARRPLQVVELVLEEDGLPAAEPASASTPLPGPAMSGVPDPAGPGLAVLRPSFATAAAPAPPPTD